MFRVGITMRIEWVKILAETPNVCGGGTLCAIVYCCPHDCPIRNVALRRLGIEKSKYLEVKNRLGIRHDGVCWKNLAYCCSPLKPCPKRDHALQELGMSLEDYLRYKAELLEELLKYAKATEDEIFKVKVVYSYFGFLYVPELGKELRVLGQYVPDEKMCLPAVILEVVNNDELRLKIHGEYAPLTIYLPRELVKKINEAEPIIGKNFTEFVAEAVKEKLMQVLQSRQGNKT